MFILKGVKVLSFDTLLQVLILKGVRGAGRWREGDGGRPGDFAGVGGTAWRASMAPGHETCRIQRHDYSTLVPYVKDYFISGEKSSGSVAVPPRDCGGEALKYCGGDAPACAGWLKRAPTGAKAELGPQA
jgi:hypothetical protein